MTDRPRTITNGYRIQNFEAAAKIIRALGPKAVKPAQRDEIVRVLEDAAERCREKTGGAA